MTHFPGLLRRLPPFEGPFDAFATHAARFEVETSEIEFWFKKEAK